MPHLLTTVPHVFIVEGMKALKTAEAVIGSQSALAKAIDVAPQVVNNWHRRGNVPADYCPAIERATQGQVTCEELRPDVDWGYLRESAQRTQITSS